MSIKKILKPYQKYNRILYIGRRDKDPTILETLNSNINVTKNIESEISDPSYQEKLWKKNFGYQFPVLLIWENSLGEKSYGEVV